MTYRNFSPIIKGIKPLKNVKNSMNPEFLICRFGIYTTYTNIRLICSCVWGEHPGRIVQRVQTIVLHSLNDKSVLRYFGPTRTWFFSSASTCCWSDVLQVGCTTLVGRIHNFRRSDTQLQVECTNFVGRMHNFGRSYAQFS